MVPSKGKCLLVAVRAHASLRTSARGRGGEASRSPVWILEYGQVMSGSAGACGAPPWPLAHATGTAPEPHAGDAAIDPARSPTTPTAPPSGHRPPLLGWGVWGIAAADALAARSEGTDRAPTGSHRSRHVGPSFGQERQAMRQVIGRGFGSPFPKGCYVRGLPVCETGAFSRAGAMAATMDVTVDIRRTWRSTPRRTRSAGRTPTRPGKATA